MLSTDFFRVETKAKANSLAVRAKTEPSWLPFLVVVNIYILGAGVLDPKAYWHIVRTTTSEMLVFSVAFISLALCVEGLLRAPGKPLGQVMRKIRQKGRFIAGGLIVVILGLSAYTTYKINIPDIMPFYADPYLAGVDRYLYGRNAWRVMHEAPMQAGLIVDVFYTRVWPAVLLFGVLGALTFVEGARLQRYAWSLFFVYAVMGTLVATLFSSRGAAVHTDQASDPEQSVYRQHHQLRGLSARCLSKQAIHVCLRHLGFPECPCRSRDAVCLVPDQFRAFMGGARLVECRYHSIWLDLQWLALRRRWRRVSGLRQRILDRNEPLLWAAVAGSASDIGCMTCGRFSCMRSKRGRCVLLSIFETYRE